MKMTWPEVTDIKKNPSRYTNRRYLCPHCTLRVSKSLDLWCVFDRLSNFEKCNLRSGHLMWPGGVTFGVIRSSFFGNVSNCWPEQLWHIWRRYAPPFFAICEKPDGGGERIPPPPGRARVRLNLSAIAISYSKPSITLLCPYSIPFHPITSLLPRNNEIKISYLWR